jgi:hypothetical protein
MNGRAEQPRAGDGDQDRRGPGRLHDELRALGDQTSAAARGYWLPLVLFGALICGSLPLYERPGLRPRPAGLVPSGSCRAVVNQPCHVSVGATHLTIVTALGYYWQLAIPAGVVLTVLWYRWRADRVGLRTPASGFLITGLILAELVLLVPLVAGHSGSPALLRLMHDTHQAGPLVIVAALLWVLAWAERSSALAVSTAVYFVAVLVVSPFDNGGIGGATGAPDLGLAELRMLGLLPALILLAAGSAAWVNQKLRRRPHGPATKVAA